ncbi:MAG: serine/threonine protein kinase [Acidobacteria bacterium]|nr:serine/threonine protein kinase [Acidobacteriota bacterium]
MQSEELYQKAKEIFYAVIDLPSTERSNYISKACQNNQELIKEVEALLIVEDSDEEFFEAIQKQLVLQAVSSFLRKKSIVGDKLRNRYIVIEELSCSSSEHFYLAEDLENLNKQVLIRTFSSTLYLTENFNENDFFKEATVLTQLKHPQIIPLLNFGKNLVGDIFIVMELSPNSDLRSLIKKNLSKDLELIANIISQLGEIIGFIHSQGIYHNNLKPESITLLQSNSLKVMVTNFGFSSLKLFSEEITQNVLPQDCQYLAPEQLINKTSKASDIFALGLIFYEMLTGQNPVALKTTSPVSLIEYAHLREKQRILPPNELNPLLTKQAADLIMQALNPSPKLRPSQGKKFCQDLASTLRTILENIPQETKKKLEKLVITSPITLSKEPSEETFLKSKFKFSPFQEKNVESEENPFVKAHLKGDLGENPRKKISNVENIFDQKLLLIIVILFFIILLAFLWLEFN